MHLRSNLPIPMALTALLLSGLFGQRLHAQESKSVATERAANEAAFRCSYLTEKEAEVNSTKQLRRAAAAELSSRVQSCRGLGPDRRAVVRSLG